MLLSCMLEKLTSFMALRDPELLAATASAVGAEAVMPLLNGPTPHPKERPSPGLLDPYYQPHRQLQRHAPPQEWLPEEDDEAKRFQQDR